MVYNWIKDKIPTLSIVKQRDNGDILIVCNHDLEILYFNQTSKDIISMIDGTRTIDEIKRIMLSGYDVGEELLELDLIDVIRDMQWKKIVYLR